MNTAAIGKVIYDRAQADTGSGGLFNSGNELITGIYNTFAPFDTAYPYIVYFLPAVTATTAFRKEIVQVDVQFSLFVETTGGSSGSSSGYDGLLVASNILARVYGDSATAQSFGTPTYGFQRWKPTLSGSWTADTMIHQNSATQHEAGLYHFIEEYRFLVYAG